MVNFNLVLLLSLPFALRSAFEIPIPLLAASVEALARR